MGILFAIGTLAFIGLGVTTLISIAIGEVSFADEVNKTMHANPNLTKHEAEQIVRAVMDGVTYGK